MWRGMMANVGTANPEDYVFSNIRGVVANTLQISRNDECVQ
jgi:hypothetical protein